MTVAILQARLGSTRLPGKVLMDLAGEPMLLRQLERLDHCTTLDALVVATSGSPGDDPLADMLEARGRPVFRGSETDVLDRYYRCAQAWNADTVVRITGDCPLICPEVVDEVVRLYRAHPRCEYGNNVEPATYPDGVGLEVFPWHILELTWREATGEEREHVTPYVRLRPEVFRHCTLRHDRDLSWMRWTVDEARDLEFVRRVYDALYREGSAFGMDAILGLLAEQPELLEINQGIPGDVPLERLREVRWQRHHGPRKLEHTRSEQLWARALPIIPAGTQTFSKGPTQYVGGVSPKYLQRAEGVRVWDVDGNEYLDCAFGLGAILLGHRYPATTKAVQDQLQEGVSFTLMHPLEVEVSEGLIEAIPSAEAVRFGKNGSDATAGAVRCARAYTGREHIAHCGYHGWQDWYIGATTRSRGVPRGDVALQHSFSYNDLDSLARVFEEYPEQVAAVIMEPVQLTEPRDGFLGRVIELSHSHGALVIFDEIVTGFRVARGGAQEHYGVMPDLTCVGKGLGNGLPISAVVGRAALMREFAEVFFSFTFGGECLSLAAAKATLHELRTEAVVERLWALGRRFRAGCLSLVEELALEEVAEVSGLPPRVMLAFREAGGAEALAVKSLFQQEAIKRGVLYSGQHFMCYAHADEDIDYMLGAYRDALGIVKRAVDARAVEQRLEGAKIQPVFRPVS